MEKHLLITRFDPARAERGEMLKVDDVLEILAIPLLGIIPESEQVLTASNLGAPVTLNSPDGAAGQAYFDAANRLMGKNVPMRIPTDRKGLLGKLFGLSVIVTCGGADKCARALEIGADHAIDYKATDFVEEVKRITGGKGVELVLDMVAGDYVPRNLKCLADDGRHVTIALLGGAKAEINMGQVMVRRLTLTGSTLRPRSDQFKALVAQEIADNVWPAVEDGELRPVMDQTFPLAQAAAAHAYMESGAHVGKVVLAV